MSKDLQYTFRRPCLEVHGEIGSLSELIGYMQEESATLTMAFGDDMELVVQRINGAAPEAGETAPTEAPKRGRGPNKPKVDAVAPAPLPVPAEAPASSNAVLPPNPLGTTADPLAIPPGLQRNAQNEAPALIAPPPALPSPPLAPLPPSAPPVGVLGPKVVAALDLHKAKGNDGGQALADWLHGAGLVQKGSTYDEACRAVLMISDEKLKGVAASFGVTA